MIDQSAGKILDSIFDIVIVVNKDLKIIDTNSAISLTGFTKEEVIGNLATDLVVDNAGLRRVIPELVAVAKNGLRDLRRFEAVRKDGTKFWVDISANDIDDTHDDDYLIVMHDVDERAKARKELEEQKAKIEAVLLETDKLRKEAESNRLQLEIANRSLEQRQQVTEAALLEEQRFRLTSQKTDFQKYFARMLVILVGLAIVIPYVSGFISVETKILDGSNNLALLLLQVLGIAVGSLFGQSNSKKDEEKVELRAI